MSSGSRWKRLKRRRSRGTMMSRVWISVRMGMRSGMGVRRVRGRRWPLIEVRIILIHHLGAAHHTPRARHPRAGLATCVPERCTTTSVNSTVTLDLPLTVHTRRQLRFQVTSFSYFTKIKIISLSCANFRDSLGVLWIESMLAHDHCFLCLIKWNTGS